jgi:hypothetical protein
VHTVVVQVERCEVALLIGYTPGTGEPTDRIVARVASQPRSHAVDALRETLAAYAMAPLTVTLDGVAVAPATVRVKVGLVGERPSVVVLATISLARGGQLAINSKDPRTTRISWEDQASGRVVDDRGLPADGARPDAARHAAPPGGRAAEGRRGLLDEGAPAQGRWFTGVASFLLPVGAAPGGSSCVSAVPTSSSPASARSWASPPWRR